MRQRKTHCLRGHAYDEANTVWHQGHQECLTCRRERDRLRYARNREARKAKVIERYWQDPEKKRAAERNRQVRIRREVLDAYGGRCAYCGSSDDLELDHVNTDGAQHRAEVGHHFAVYLDLLKAGCPQDGRVQPLCRPCHLEKSRQEQIGKPKKRR